MHFIKILTDIGGPVPLLITGVLVMTGAVGFLMLSARRRKRDKAVIWD